MPRTPHEQAVRLVPIMHMNLLDAKLHVHPLAVYLILIGIVRIYALYVEVLYIRTHHGIPPGYSIGLTNHDPERSGD